MAAVRWLLVGAGDIARKRVAAALADSADSELVAVCDTVEENAKSLAEERSVAEVFTDITGALSHTSADSVYVATPVWLHVDHTVQALEAGKHVLVEKPLGIDADSCSRAIAAAERSPMQSGCAYYRRTFPAYQQAREMVKAGAFGQVVLLRMVYFSWFDPTPDDSKRWRIARERSGGGPISDMGTHMFDVMIGLLGMPVRVYARCENVVHDWDVEDTASVVMTMENGAQATASFSWGSKTWRHEFEIVGTEAKVYWHPYDSGEVVKTVGRDVEALDLAPAQNVHQPIVEDFVGAIQQGRPPACPLSEAAKTNVLVDAIYRSAAEGREIELQE
ncbi:MAG: Gfo/Idh/MocA family oxidoreductase [Candidatus Latescibacteria bacterium]|jgi:predicted dehydrogenase|nr:Gfo/Idh/MocA family oxidoreductase [Candidatus Latescibacterota bacterium]